MLVTKGSNTLYIRKSCGRLSTVEELSSAPEVQGAVLSSLPKVASVWHCVSFAAVLISIWDGNCMVGKPAVGTFVTERCEV